MPSALPHTSLQHSIVPSTLVCTISCRSSSVLSVSGVNLYALVPALLILYMVGGGAKVRIALHHNWNCVNLVWAA